MQIVVWGISAINPRIVDDRRSRKNLANDPLSGPCHFGTRFLAYLLSRSWMRVKTTTATTARRTAVPAKAMR